MKYNNVFYLFLMLSVLWVSCSKEFDERDIRSCAPEIHVINEYQQTKTRIDDESGHVYWSDWDQITVFFGETGVYYSCERVDDSGIAIFKMSRSNPAVDFSRKDVTGVYNCNVESCSDGVFTLSPYGWLPTLGKMSQSNHLMTFYNIYGGVRFKVQSKGITSVTLKGNNNEDLTGKIKVAFNEEGIPVVKEVVEGKKEITLSANFQPGVWYYIATMPVELTKGYTLTFTTDIKSSTRVDETPVTIKRSIFGSIDNADANLIWKARKDISPTSYLNKAVIADQQNPNDAERVFVLYWSDIARQDGENSGRSTGNSNDEWAGCLHNLTQNCVKHATNAIRLSEAQLIDYNDEGSALLENYKYAAKIWRVYLMTEYVDSFGSYITDFESDSPEYRSVEDCYKFMFQELSEAVSAINPSVLPASPDEITLDPAYSFDFAKWKNFGISMWMRTAMRLSEVAPELAKAEFSKAVAAGTGITTIDGTFRVKEDTGWNDLSGVMSRTWDWQQLSATMANLTTNLGGAKAIDIIKDKDGRFYKSAPDATKLAQYESRIKDANKYLGVHMTTHFENLYEEYTDNPTQGFYFDGLPEYFDPRLMAYYCLPGDYDNRKETGYIYFMSVDGGDFAAPSLQNVLLSFNGVLYSVDARYALNGLVCGWQYDNKVSDNNLIDNYGKTYPSLQERYRNCSEYRVFFGPWETNFLMSEAALRGWIPGDAATYYYAGIKSSFDYLGLSSYYADYVDSGCTNHNRVGVSVNFDDDTDPKDFEIGYIETVNGENTTTYHYPVASKTVYGKAINDKLAKIITQKYIANCPYLPLESWSDHRRLGLPFWEIPVGSSGFPFLDGWTTDSYKNGQKPGYYAQRMIYPSSFSRNNPEQYQNALNLMGMTNESTVAPLWWAKH